MRAARFLLLALLVATVAEFPVAAVRPVEAEILRAAPLGPIVEAPDGRSEMELVRIDERVTAMLQALAPEETLRIDGWPVSPGQRAQVVLRRFDVYAPDAKIVVIENGREIEIPRSRTVYFMGSRFDGTGRFAVGLDPDTGSFRGAQSDAGVLFEIQPREDGSGLHRVAARAAFDPEGTPERSWACGQESLPLEENGPPISGPPSVPEGTSSGQAVSAATKVAVIAVETDNELMSLKFSNNPTSATTYIANLFVAMNVIYERDASLRLLQGYTILRPSTTADPYSQAGTGNADSLKLAEFRTHWNAHYAPVKRALAMILSGKQGSSNSASGIATLNVLCGSSGYSFNQVFKFQEQTASWDVGIVAHEIGHNMASPHTHCYADTRPDLCYRLEGGCFSGTTACPALATYNGVSARGTLMSYCHVSAASGGVDGCSKADVYHPDSLTRYVNGAVAAASSCIFGIGVAAPTISTVSPAVGPLAGGTSLVLTGANFGSGATVAFVELPSNDVFGTPSSRAAASVTFNGSTQLTVTTPSATNLGAVDVVVMNPDFQTARRASGFTYSAALPAPTVTAVLPNTGSTAGGTSVTITGTNFVATPAVRFGGTDATAEVFVNATTLTATVPAHAAGLVDVLVTNPDAQAGTRTSGYSYAAAPTATSWHAVTPCRVIDTRLANAPLGGPALSANQTRTFDVTTAPETCGLPSTARTLTGNYSATGAEQPGELRAFAGDALWTGTSILSFGVGATRANSGHLGLAGNGSGTFSVTNASPGAVHFTLDVNGYFQ